MSSKTIKNFIVAIHRWFGFTLCLLFIMWFLSGIVMMYATFPNFSEKKRLLYSKALHIEECSFSPATLAGTVSQDTAWASIRMVTVLNRPVSVLENKEGEIQSFYADNGAFMKELPRDSAVAVATGFFHHQYKVVSTEKISELDQWIPRSFYMKYMPIYRIHMNDAAASIIYVSAKTGGTILVHNRTDRFLSWIGPIPHWIYPKDLIVRRPLWRFIVITLSSLGIIASLSGMITGFIRLKKKRKTRFDISPYQKKWFRWHHYTGFIFGFFTFTWIFSGLLTMSPANWTPDITISDREQQQLATGNLRLRPFYQPVKNVFKNLPATFIPVEIQFKRFQGRGYYIAYDAKGKSIAGIAGLKNITLTTVLPDQLLINGIKKLLPDALLTESISLREEDDYYYSKQHDLPLPVWRIKFNDAEKTWFYVNPANGNIMQKNNQLSRINRWFYHGLHSLDFFRFFHNRPLWDLVTIFLLLGGTAVSVTGMVLTFKWLRKT